VFVRGQAVARTCQEPATLRETTAEGACLADDLACLVDMAPVPIFGIDLCGSVTEWEPMTAVRSVFAKP